LRYSMTFASPCMGAISLPGPIWDGRDEVD
jgi:hypothetical protein